MTKRWAEAELRFLRDNSEKMSVQALADALSVRIDDLEKKMKALASVGGSADAPAPKKAQRSRSSPAHEKPARTRQRVSAYKKKSTRRAALPGPHQKFPTKKSSSIAPRHLTVATARRDTRPP